MRYFTLLFLFLALLLSACATGRLRVSAVDSQTNRPVEVEEINVTTAKGKKVAVGNQTDHLDIPSLRYKEYTVTVSDNTSILALQNVKLDRKLLDLKIKVPRIEFKILDSETRQELRYANITIRSLGTVIRLDYPASKFVRLPEGDYVVEVRAAGYENLTENRVLYDGVNTFILIKPRVDIFLLPVDAESDRTISQPATTFSVSQNGTKVGGFSYPNQTSIRLSPNTEYAVKAENSAYVTFNGSFQTADKNESYNVKLKPVTQVFTLTLNIYNSKTGKKISDASVYLDGDNWSGGNPLELVKGTYTLKVQKSEYEPYERKFSLTSDLDLDVPLVPGDPPRDYKVTFNVVDESGQPVSNPTLKVGKTKLSGNTITKQPGTYTCTASKGGKSGNAKFTVNNKDITVKVVIKGDNGGNVPSSPKQRTHNSTDDFTYSLKDPNTRHTLKVQWTEGGKTKAGSIAMGKTGSGSGGGVNSITVKQIVSRLGIKAAKITVTQQ